MDGSDFCFIWWEWISWDEHSGRTACESRTLQANIFGVLSWLN